MTLDLTWHDAVRGACESVFGAMPFAAVTRLAPKSPGSSETASGRSWH